MLLVTNNLITKLTIFIFNFFLIKKFFLSILKGQFFYFIIFKKNWFLLFSTYIQLMTDILLYI